MKTNFTNDRQGENYLFLTYFFSKKIWQILIFSLLQIILPFSNEIMQKIYFKFPHDT